MRSVCDFLNSLIQYDNFFKIRQIYNDNWRTIGVFLAAPPTVNVYSRRSRVYSRRSLVITDGGAAFTVEGAVFTVGGATFTVRGAVFTVFPSILQYSTPN